MKRLIGRFLLAGLLASGAGVATAAPSSAMPRNECMDAVHYWEQMSWYGNMMNGEFDVLLSWDAADYTLNPVSGMETWSTTLPSGTYAEVHTLADYNQRVSDASAAWSHTYHQMTEFESANAPC